MADPVIITNVAIIFREGSGKNLKNIFNYIFLGKKLTLMLVKSYLT